ITGSSMEEVQVLITRRGLLKGAAALGLAAPAARAYAWIPDRPSPKTLADAALAVATSGGASYADVRLVRLRREAISTRDDHVTGVNRFESLGLRVGVLKGGAGGFSATPTLTAEKARQAARHALAIATANAAMLRQPIRLALEPPHEDSWQTPIEKDPFRVPLQVKTTLLLEANKAARSAGSIRRNPLDEGGAVYHRAATRRQQLWIRGSRDNPNCRSGSPANCAESGGSREGLVQSHRAAAGEVTVVLEDVALAPLFGFIAMAL